MLDVTTVAEDAPEILQELAVSALSSWGKNVREISLVKMRENAVFRVVDSRGDTFALRVHRAGYHSDAALRSELEWMAALQAQGIDLPAIVPATDGSLSVSAQIEGIHAPRQIDLLEWFHGRPLGTSEGGLGDLPDAERTYQTVGRIAARLHNHASEWELPSGFSRHRWDAEGLVGEQPLWGRFWELDALTAAERDLMLRARARVHDELREFADRGDAQRHFSMIHADFVPENLLRSEQGEVRLIDFDDSGFGWHLFELATALYFIQDSADYEIARKGLIEGYRAHRELSDDILQKLPVFMMARGFTYLGWSHSRPGSKEGRAITQHVIRLACRQADRLLNNRP